MVAYQKEIISHPYLYVAHFKKPDIKENLIFIHGGPGFNCGVLEFFIEHDAFFDSLHYNIVIYDQRGCGRSIKDEAIVSHKDNIDDLNHLISFLEKDKIAVCGLMGHSYGAKLLLDFYKSYHSIIPAVFIGIADSMLTPRLNNLMSDLVYLKKIDSAKYQQILSTLKDVLTLDDLWALTEDLAPIFQANQDRPYHMWANLTYMKKSQDIQKLINIPINQAILMSVRKDIYVNEDNCRVDIENMHIPYLWINGFHDYAMNGAMNFFDNKNVTLFYQSGHYPHIEENSRFCEIVNDFFKSI